jgi:hypothetical protein
VGEREPITRLALGWVIIGLMFVGGLLSLYLVQMSSVSIAGYDLERLEEERQLWRSRNQQLEVELAKRRSLAWAEVQAVERLGMTRAERPIFIPASPSADSGPVGSSDVDGRGKRVANASSARQPALSPGEVLRRWWSELWSRRA